MAVGVGNVQFISVVGEKSFLITLCDVLYVPQLPINLLSVAQATKTADAVIFTEKSAQVIHKSVVVIEAMCNNNLYTVNSVEQALFASSDINH